MGLQWQMSREGRGRTKGGSSQATKQTSFARHSLLTLTPNSMTTTQTPGTQQERLSMWVRSTEFNSYVELHACAGEIKYEHNVDVHI